MPIINLNGTKAHYHLDDFSPPWIVKPPALLIHSAGGNLNRWRQWMPNLAKSRPVVRLDLRGHGESSPGEIIESVDQLVQDIEALMGYLQYPTVHLIGASAGGVVGIRVAEQLKTSIKTLTLVASTPFLAKTTIDTQRWGEILKTQGTEAWLKADSDLRFGPETHQQVIDWYAKEGSKTPANSVISLQSVLLSEDYVPLLPRIHIPSLILASQTDGITPPHAQETLHLHLPDSQLVWFENVGHNLKLEIPEQLSQICSDFMESNDDLST